MGPVVERVDGMAVTCIYRAVGDSGHGPGVTRDFHCGRKAVGVEVVGGFVGGGCRAAITPTPIVLFSGSVR